MHTQIGATEYGAVKALTECISSGIGMIGMDVFQRLTSIVSPTQMVWVKYAVDKSEVVSAMKQSAQDFYSRGRQRRCRRFPSRGRDIKRISEILEISARCGEKASCTPVGHDVEGMCAIERHQRSLSLGGNRKLRLSAP